MVDSELFVAPLPREYSDEQLRALFEEIGEVVSFNRPIKLDRNIPSKHAIIRMATVEAAREVIARLRGYVFPGYENSEEYGPLAIYFTAKREKTPENLGREMARKLNERHPRTRELLIRIVEQVGYDQTNAVLKKALRLEAEGGLMVEDGSRRRTPGGVFFYLLKAEIGIERFREILPKFNSKDQPQTARAAPRPPARKEPPFDFAQRRDVLLDLLKESGSTQMAKHTAIGRPEKVIPQTGCVVVHFSRVSKGGFMPKGVPQPPETPTHYIVYIPTKQWAKIATALDDPKDFLVVEGYGTITQGSMSVYATSATTMNLQRARFAKNSDKTANS
ncbi:MAG: hypothetical protein HXY40_08775 [Chloroflexi bacterium]|nr:hypothetical protein [Chloroflexota bacterium]